MKFSAHLRIDNFKYFIDCLCCVNRLSKEISKSSINFIRITREKTNIITKTSGVLDTYFEIYNSELFVEPITLDRESLTIEINFNTLFDSLNSTLRSDYVILNINDKEDENLYIKYLDSIYTTIDITLKIPVSIVPDCSNKLPEIPFTNYNLNLVKLQTISFLLYSLNRIGNTVVEFEISKQTPSEDNLFNKCILTLRSEGRIVNLETVFYEFKVFSSYPSEEENIIEETENENISVFVNTNSLNILLKSIIEANLYNQNKSLIIISIPEDYTITRSVYIIISIIHLDTCQMIFVLPNVKE